MRREAKEKNIRLVAVHPAAVCYLIRRFGGSAAVVFNDNDEGLGAPYARHIQLALWRSITAQRCIN